MTTSIERLIDRLENYYDFECEAGPLRSCLEWQQLRAALVPTYEPCPRCKGTGTVDGPSFRDPLKSIETTCRICKGSGRLAVYTSRVPLRGDTKA